MPRVPIEFLRGLVGFIGIGCAHMLARSVVAFRKGQVPVSRVYAWLIRTLLCLLAVWYPARPDVDTEDIAIWFIAAAAFAAGWWGATRARKQEDLTHEIFPESGGDAPEPPARR